MDKETFKVAQKVHDDILFFSEGRRKIAESFMALPMQTVVIDYILECLDKKLHELENEFKQL